MKCQARSQTHRGTLKYNTPRGVTSSRAPPNMLGDTTQWRRYTKIIERSYIGHIWHARTQFDMRGHIWHDFSHQQCNCQNSWTEISIDTHKATIATMPGSRGMTMNQLYKGSLLGRFGFSTHWKTWSLGNFKRAVNPEPIKHTHKSASSSLHVGGWGGAPRQTGAARPRAHKELVGARVAAQWSVLGSPPIGPKGPWAPAGGRQQAKLKPDIKQTWHLGYSDRRETYKTTTFRNHARYIIITVQQCVTFNIRMHRFWQLHESVSMLETHTWIQMRSAIHIGLFGTAILIQ